MKKYYLHNGNEQQGPYDYDDLKKMNLNKDTPVWYEGLSNWKEIGQIEELQSIFEPSTPPPFANKKNSPPPINKKIPQVSDEIISKKKSKKVPILIITFSTLFIIIIGIIVIFAFSVGTNKGSETQSDSYNEKVMTVEEIEQQQPTNFLTVEGNYESNFWGDKIKIHGQIKSEATVAVYKDVVIRVIYLSKTNTELGNNEYTIYETIQPRSTVKFDLKVDNFKDVKSIDLKIISATPE